MTSTTTSTEDQRTRAQDLAQKHLTDLLTGDRIPYDFDGDWQMLSDLLSTRDEFQQIARRITDDLASAVKFATGGSGRMNSLGVLQGDATRVDGLAMLFHARVSYAKDLLFDHYLAKIRETEAEWETVEAFGPHAAECVEQARIMAQATGSTGATHSIASSADDALAPTSSATVRRVQS